jgi:hypothetical protein
LLKQAGLSPSSDSTAEVRYCKRHGDVVFHLYGAGKPGQRWRCKRCVGEAVTRRHQKIKRILVAEGGGGCALCGYEARKCVLVCANCHGEIEAGLIPSPPPQARFKAA